MVLEMLGSICDLLTFFDPDNAVTIILCPWPIMMYLLACDILPCTKHFPVFFIKKRCPPHATLCIKMAPSTKHVVGYFGPTYQSYATHCTYKIKLSLLCTVSWQQAIPSGLYILGSDEVYLQLHKLYTRYQRLFGMFCIQST